MKIETACARYPVKFVQVKKKYIYSRLKKREYYHYLFPLLSIGLAKFKTIMKACIKWFTAAADDDVIYFLCYSLPCSKEVGLQVKAAKAKYMFTYKYRNRE